MERKRSRRRATRTCGGSLGQVCPDRCDCAAPDKVLHGPAAAVRGESGRGVRARGVRRAPSRASCGRSSGQPQSRGRRARARDGHSHSLDEVHAHSPGPHSSRTLTSSVLLLRRQQTPRSLYNLSLVLPCKACPSNDCYARLHASPVAPSRAVSPSTRASSPSSFPAASPPHLARDALRPFPYTRSSFAQPTPDRATLPAPESPSPLALPSHSPFHRFSRRRTSSHEHATATSESPE